MILRYIFIFLFVLISAPVYKGFSQTLTEQAALDELKRRGLEGYEDRIKTELLQRGIDIDKVDVTDPIEVAKTQKALDEIVAKIQKEKAAEKSSIQTTTPQNTLVDTIKPDMTSDIKKIVKSDKELIEAVEGGASLEEAITEELLEKQKSILPEAVTFGQHIFRNQSVKFYRKASDAKAPSSYILGPGDKVSISIWGLSIANFTTEITSDGFVQLDGPSRTNRIYLSGLKLSDAKEVIRSQLSRSMTFRPGDFDVTVTSARTINVNISGEVFNNGNFSMSALNNAFNALVAAGGPNDLGSVRNIKLIRAGEAPRTLDIYKYLNNPIVGDDYFLQSNDYINVPIAEKVVSINGEIKRPFKYELLDGETLEGLINYAGGLTDLANQKNIQILRIEKGEIKIIDVDYNLPISKSTSLLKGDVVSINKILSELKDVVSIQGAVKTPGRFAYDSGMKISDLLSKAEVQDKAILDVAYLRRLNQDRITVRYEIINISEVLSNPSSAQNLPLERGDELTIKGADSFVERSVFEVVGAVRSEGQYQLDNIGDLRVSDAIFLSGGLKPDALTAFAFIFRKVSPDVPNPEFISVNLLEAVSNPQSEANILLEPNDVLQIYSRYNFEDRAIVTIEGAVRKPGEFTYNPTMTLQQIIQMSNGLKLEAAPNRINVYRIVFTSENETKTLAANLKINADFSIDSGGDFQLMPFDQIVVRSAPEFELQRNVSLNGEIKYPGKYVLLNDNTKLTDVIKDAGGLTDEAFVRGATLYRQKESLGYVIINLEKAWEDKNSFHNIILQEGDIIQVPKISNLVSIQGATKASELYPPELLNEGKPLNFPFEKGKNAKFYIEKYAGGVGDNGHKGRITVTYPNGEIKKSGRFLFFRSYPEVKPGSKIVVGYKDLEPPKVEGEESKIDWGEVLSNSVAQATAVLSLILLVRSVN